MAIDLRKERLDRGWTLEDLRRELARSGTEAHITTLSKIERRKQMPRPGLRKALSELFDLDVTDFERRAN